MASKKLIWLTFVKNPYFATPPPLGANGRKFTHGPHILSLTNNSCNILLNLLWPRAWWAHLRAPVSARLTSLSSENTGAHRELSRSGVRCEPACDWSAAANTGLWLAGSGSVLSASLILIGWCRPGSSYGQESSLMASPDQAWGVGWWFI